MIWWEKLNQLLNLLLSLFEFCVGFSLLQCEGFFIGHGRDNSLPLQTDLSDLFVVLTVICWVFKEFSKPTEIFFVFWVSQKILNSFDLLTKEFFDVFDLSAMILGLQLLRHASVQLFKMSHKFQSLTKSIFLETVIDHSYEPWHYLPKLHCESVPKFLDRPFLA